MKQFFDLLKKNLIVVVFASIGTGLLIFYFLSYRPSLMKEALDEKQAVSNGSIGFNELQKKINENKEKKRILKTKNKFVEMISVNEKLFKTKHTNNFDFVEGRNILKKLIKETDKKKLSLITNKKIFCHNFIYKGFYKFQDKKTALIEIEKIESNRKKKLSKDNFNIDYGKIIKFNKGEKIGNTPIWVHDITSKKLVLKVNSKKIEIPINIISKVVFKK